MPKKTLVKIDSEVHYQLKLFAMEQRKSLELVTSEALADWMKGRKLRRIIVEDENELKTEGVLVDAV